MFAGIRSALNFSGGDEEETAPDTNRMVCVRGLDNLGNTCYLNAVLQAVSSCPGFVSHVHHMSALDANTNKFSNHLHKCLVGLRTGRSGATSYNPHRILKLLAKFNPNFEGNDQQDALEVFESLLACIKEENSELASKRKAESRHKMANLSHSLLPIPLFHCNGSVPAVNVNMNTLICPFEGWSSSHLECQACIKLAGASSTRWMPTRHQIFSMLPLPIAVSGPDQLGVARLHASAGCLPAGQDSKQAVPLPGGSPIEVTLGISSRSSSATRSAFPASRNSAFSEQPKLHKSLSIYHCLQELFQSEDLSQISCSACSIAATHSAVERKLSVSSRRNRDRRTATAEEANGDDLARQIMSEILDQCKAMRMVGERDALISDFDQGFIVHPLNNNRKEVIVRGAVKDTRRLASTNRDSTEKLQSDREMLLLSLKQPRFSDAVKHTSISRLPPLLCLYLCRRTFDPLKGCMQKLAHHVAFPFLLHMDQFQSADGASRSHTSQVPSVADMLRYGGKEKLGNGSYQLKAVVEHLGNAEKGHYVSYCLVSDRPQRRWEFFSDDQHHSVAEDRVLAAQATMLFYEKVL